MKRPIGLWILLSIGVIWLNTQDVYGIRATSLIYSKTSTTTTTPSTTAASDEKSNSSEEPDTTEAQEGTSNSSKPVLTGNPQIDYIWDPNLPKELNGYNLSDYPFYERVPENITFKCDGLHDGFYASVLHKCQVYHHCLFGIRYDFLCANYTAFDQTLFNCNFVSNVDCQNSKKFWNRNDELYKTKSTTPPPVVYNFYTQSPPTFAAQPIRRIPQRRGPLIANHAPVPVEAHVEALPPLPVQNVNEAPMAAAVPMEQPSQVPMEIPLEPRRRARPPMRQRPAYYDYYDDYDDPPRYVRKRPRPRPYYDDDDYEYYDDIYYRRNEGRRRRPYERPMRRYKGRRDRYEDEEDYDEYDRNDRYVDEEDSGKKKMNRGSPTSGITRYNLRKQPLKPIRKVIDDDYEEYEERVTNTRAKGGPTRNRNRRPSNEYEDDAIDETNLKNNKKGSQITLDETKTITRSTGGSIFDRPRVASKINLPVPKNVAEKYKTMSLKGKEGDAEIEDEEAALAEKASFNTETPEVITTTRAGLKRNFMSRRQTSEGKSTVKTPTRKVQTASSDETEEVQNRGNSRQTSVRGKTPQSRDTIDVPEMSNTRRTENTERLKATTRVNIFKTRHSLSTPEVMDVKDSDELAEIDDSINEA